MCDQAPETINHILVGCTFAREFWYRFLSQVGLQSLSPYLTYASFYDGGRGLEVTTIVWFYKESILL
jgi:hypothetical protein